MFYFKNNFDRQKLKFWKAKQNICNDDANVNAQWHSAAGLFQKKNFEKKHLCDHDKNYYYFCTSNIPVIILI